MNRKKFVPVLVLLILVLATLACGGGAPSDDEAQVTSPPAAEATKEPAAPKSPPAESEPETEVEQPDYDTVFPLPDNVQNLHSEGEGINFQTNLSVDEAIEFYRAEFAEKGMAEYEPLTVIADAAFSLVFTGWSNDQDVVVEGTDIGGNTNIDVRLAEAVDVVQITPPPDAPVGLGIEMRQWATSATASSEYGTPKWGAIQATGEPNTSRCGDIDTAWASKKGNSVEWIELEYLIPVRPGVVNIIQTNSPDQVVLVELIDTDGVYHEIYVGEPENKSDDCPYTLSIQAPNANYQVTGIMITIDQSVIPAQWNEIDAVELIGLAD